MRVVLTDPPAFTPAYDHELAAALARAGADVALVSSHFRFGEAPPPDGYARRELFYPLSSRVFRRSRLRLPLKIAICRGQFNRLLRVAKRLVQVAPAADRQPGQRVVPPRTVRVCFFADDPVECGARIRHADNQPTGQFGIRPKVCGRHDW